MLTKSQTVRISMHDLNLECLEKKNYINPKSMPELHYKLMVIYSKINLWLLDSTFNYKFNSITIY